MSQVITIFLRLAKKSPQMVLLHKMCCISKKILYQNNVHIFFILNLSSFFLFFLSLNKTEELFNAQGYVKAFLMTIDKKVNDYLQFQVRSSILVHNTVIIPLFSCYFPMPGHPLNCHLGVLLIELPDNKDKSRQIDYWINIRNAA